MHFQHTEEMVMRWAKLLQARSRNCLYLSCSYLNSSYNIHSPVTSPNWRVFTSASWGRPRTPGRGEIDWLKLINALLNVNNSGNVDIEGEIVKSITIIYERCMTKPYDPATNSAKDLLYGAMCTTNFPLPKSCTI